MSNYLPETHENSDRSIVLGRSKAESEGQISISDAAAQSFAPQAVADSQQNELPRPYNRSEPFVFISYSHKDFTEAVSIIKALQTSNYRVWYDDGIDPGTEWDDTIAAHVENCGLFAALISTNYLNSDNCKDELSFARDLSKNRLLIYLENVTLPRGLAMRLNRLQAIHKYRYGDFAAFCKKLYETQGLDICLDISADERIKEQTVAQPQQVRPHVVSNGERIEMPDLILTDKPQTEMNANLADSVGLHGSALDRSPKAVEQEQLPSGSAEIKNNAPTDSVERKLTPQAAQYEPEAMIEPDVCVEADAAYIEDGVSEQAYALNDSKFSSTQDKTIQVSTEAMDTSEAETAESEYTIDEFDLCQPNTQEKVDNVFTLNTAKAIFGAPIQATLEIPPKYEVIKEEAFCDTEYFMEKVDKIIIPTSVKKIGSHAFWFIQAQEIVIPNSVVEIGEETFNLSDNGFIRCDAGSAAYRYAVANKLRNTVDDKLETDATVQKCETKGIMRWRKAKEAKQRHKSEEAMQRHEAEEAIRKRKAEETYWQRGWNFKGFF